VLLRRAPSTTHAPAGPHFTCLTSSIRFWGRGPFGTAVPCRVHRQHRVPVWVRAGPSARRFGRAALVVAPLSVAEPDSPKSVRSLLSLLASFAIGIVDCAELHFVRFRRRVRLRGGSRQAT